MRWRNAHYADLDRQPPYKASSAGSPEATPASPPPPSESEVALGDWITVPLAPSGPEGPDVPARTSVDSRSEVPGDRRELEKRLQEADALQRLERGKGKGAGAGAAYAQAGEPASASDGFIPPLAVPAIWPDGVAAGSAAAAAAAAGGSGKGALSGVTAVSDGEGTGRVAAGPGVAGAESPVSTRGRAAQGRSKSLRSAVRSTTGLLPGPGDSTGGALAGLDSTQSRGTSVSNSGTASLVQESVAAAVRKLQERLQEDLQADHLHLHAVLGRGGFGIVHRGAPLHAWVPCVITPAADVCVRIAGRALHAAMQTHLSNGAKCFDILGSQLRHVWVSRAAGCAVYQRLLSVWETASGRHLCQTIVESGGDGLHADFRHRHHLSLSLESVIR